MTDAACFFVESAQKCKLGLSLFCHFFTVREFALMIDYLFVA
jgi:hypothetical protein